MNKQEGLSIIGVAVADVIKQKREAMEISQAGLAEAAGLKDNRISLIENFERITNFNLDDLDDIARGLGCCRLSDLIRAAEVHLLKAKPIEPVDPEVNRGIIAECCAKMSVSVSELHNRGLRRRYSLSEVRSFLEPDGAANLPVECMPRIELFLKRKGLQLKGGYVAVKAKVKEKMGK